MCCLASEASWLGGKFMPSRAENAIGTKWHQIATELGLLGTVSVTYTVYNRSNSLEAQEVHAEAFKKA
jgi:hypothetical protein